MKASSQNSFDSADDSRQHASELTVTKETIVRGVIIKGVVRNSETGVEKVVGKSKKKGSVKGRAPMPPGAGEEELMLDARKTVSFDSDSNSTLSSSSSSKASKSGSGSNVARVSFVSTVLV